MTRFDLPENAHPTIRSGFDCWRSIHPAGGGLPGRQHFDPAMVPKLLPYIWLIDVSQDPLQLRYRLLGHEIRRTTGYDGTVIGRSFADFDPGFRPGQTRYESFAAVVREGQPDYRRGTPRFPPDLGHLVLERVILPMAADGSKVDMLFCVSVFMPRPPGEENAAP